MNGVSNIPYATLYECNLLQTVEFSKEGVINCGNYAFRGRGIKKELVLRPNFKLGNWVFSWCPDLTKVTIMNGVTNISENTFYGCGFTKLVPPPNAVLGKEVFISCSCQPLLVI